MCFDFDNRCLVVITASDDRRASHKLDAIHKQLHANRVRLDKLHDEAKASSSSLHVGLVNELEAKWLELESETHTCRQRVDTACRERAVREQTTHLAARLHAIGEQLGSTQSSNADLSSVKQALKRHQALMAQLDIERELLQDHKSSTELRAKLDALVAAARVKSESLQAELKTREIIFECDEELSWMVEAERRIFALYDHNGDVNVSIRKLVNIERSINGTCLL